MRGNSSIRSGLVFVALASLAGCHSGGSGDAAGTVPPPPGTGGGVIPLPPASDGPRTRYSFNNGCFVLKSRANGKYVAAAGANYAATADKAGAQRFFLKPSALGEYLLSITTVAGTNTTTSLVSATGCSSGTVCNEDLASVADDDIARFMLKAAGDPTQYPAAPQYNIEPTADEITAYRTFKDPLVKSMLFTLGWHEGQPDAKRLFVGGDNSLGLEAAANPVNVPEQFAIEIGEGCTVFPEAESGATGTTLKGTTAGGQVLGMADVHVHMGSTTFLGNALAGKPFDKFGVTHALPDCAAQHGQGGSRDVIGGFLSGGGNPAHNTDGWPTFTQWPSAESLTHQAIYWKWLERAWMAGLRIMVNDLVENGTLCELQRNNSQDPTTDCDEMNEAGRQAGTMYALQDYIDAQYGGPGVGWLRIVTSPAEARQVIASGRLAMVLGIEISNFLGCQVTYNPNPQRKEPQFEPTDGGVGENSYACAMTETGPNGVPGEILYELKRIRGWGVHQAISIHEFDNAFGGNGVFFPIINLGNRENSGGIPSGSYTGGWTPSQTPTGEYWTTYDCPVEGTTPGFTGYFWGDSGGASGADLRAFASSDPLPFNCTSAGLATGQGGRWGGPVPCYPDGQQCNARWMTPIAVYMYSKLMSMGFLFDFDHMELAMKTQALEMTETQNPVYPIISTHGTFGGTSNDQARRVLKNGGFLYPSLGSSHGFVSDMHETRARYVDAFGSSGPLFGFGFGTDTNGLSGQAGTESNVAYPYVLFHDATNPASKFGAPYASASVTFEKPRAGSRTWDIATDGSAEYGMLSDLVAAMNATPNSYASAQDIDDLYNSAERYLQTWEKTELAAKSFDASKITAKQADILRPAPIAGQTSTLP